MDEWRAVAQLEEGKGRPTAHGASNAAGGHGGAKARHGSSDGCTAEDTVTVVGGGQGNNVEGKGSN